MQLLHNVCVAMLCYINLRNAIIAQCMCSYAILYKLT